MRKGHIKRLRVFELSGNWYYGDSMDRQNRATCNKLLQCGYIELQDGVYKVSAAGEAVEL